MSSKKILLPITLGLLAFTGKIDAACKQCSSKNFVACLNETAYELCLNGIRTGMIGECQGDEVCTELEGVCRSRQSGPTLSCGVCNTCVLGYACISQTEFDLCDNTSLMGGNLIGIKEECPPGQYCNQNHFIQFRKLCISPCEGEPSCYAAKKVPPPGKEYTEVCKGKARGVYANVYDPTCTQYVYCEEYNGVMNSILYTCKDGYFSEASSSCVTVKPNRCL